MIVDFQRFLSLNCCLFLLRSGTTVTVGGDEVLSRLRSGVEEETEEGYKEKTNAKDKLEIVESRWLGFKHVVRDTSRD